MISILYKINTMPIKNVKVIPGCIRCKACENVAPAIFKVQPKSKVISDKFNEYQSEILQAEAICPVQVIKVDTVK
jgi:ferredoxin